MKHIAIMFPTKFVPKFQRKPDLQVTDEFFMNKNKLQLIGPFKEKVERMYQVEMSFGDEVEGGQWMMLKGVPVDRRNAKNYITALCDPSERQEIQFPTKACVDFIDFMDAETLEHIEKQTNAVIKPLKNIAEFEICGTDLAVTLALSLMEEIVRSKEVSEEGQTEGGDAETSSLLISPSTQAGAHRLSNTLERALSQHSDGVCHVDDYNGTPDAVKRVLVNCLTDTTTDDMDDDLLFSGGAAASCRANARAMSGSSPDIDIDGDADMEARKRKSPGLSDKLSVTLTTGPATTPLLSKQQEYLRNFGASVGYSKEEVDEALMFVDEKTRPSDFLDLLNSVKQKSEVNQSTESEPDVVILETETIDLTNKSLSADTPGRTEQAAADQASFATELPDKYKAQLLMDFFQEDDNCSVEELKRRNRERQKLLKLNFQQQQEASTSGEKYSAKQQQAARTQPGTQDKHKGQATDTHTESPGKKNRQSKQSKKQKRDDAKKSKPKDDDETCVLTPWQPDDNVICVDLSGTNTSQPPVDWTTPKRKQSKGQVATKQNYPVPAVNTYQRQPSPGRIKDNVRAKPTQVVNPSNVPTDYTWCPPHPPPLLNPDQLRYIVIDGSNVAMTHGNGKYFSCKGLRICVDYFKQRGHTKIMVFVPHWRRARPRDDSLITDQEILDTLKDEDCLVFTPSRRIRGKLVAAYDDRYVLELAEAEDGIVVSNDQYRDLMQEKASWRTLIEQRPHALEYPLQTYSGNQGSQFNYGRGQGQTPAYNQWQGQDLIATDNPRQGYSNTGPARHQNAPAHGALSQNVADGGSRQVHNTQSGRNQAQFRKDYPKPQQTEGQGHGHKLRVRSDDATDGLYRELKTIFPEEHQEDKLRQVLSNHEGETDLTKLTNYCISILPHALEYPLQTFSGNQGSQFNYGRGQGQTPAYNQWQGQDLIATDNPRQGYSNTGPARHQNAPAHGALSQNVADGGSRQVHNTQSGRNQAQFRKDYPKPQQTEGQGHGHKLRVRSDDATDGLYRELKTIFPEEHQEDKLRQVLSNHEGETDLTKLTNYCISVLFS